MSVEIPPNEIAQRKVVGKVRDDDVIYVKTIGGLHLMFLKKAKKPELLAAAPHVAVARYLANENNHDIQWTELSKSQHLDVKDFEHVLPEYRTLTNTLKSE